MTTILYFAVTRLQERYFTQLAENLNCPGKVVHHGTLHSVGWFAADETIRNVIDDGVKADMAIVRAKKRLWGKGILGWAFEAVLQIRGRIQAYRYERLLAQTDPSIVALWNNRKSRQALMAALAQRRGIRPIYFENGLLPDTTTVDWSGVNADNSLPRDAAFYRSYPGTGAILPDRLVPREQEMGKVLPESGCRLPEKFIFVPFQVDYDSQIVYHSSWIRDMEHLARVVLDALRDPSLSVVFKEHPSSEVDYSLLRREIQCDSVVFANDCPTQELIERSEAVVTINSTVGLESLLLGKKVIVLGNAFYRIEGLVMGASSGEELARSLSALDTWQVDTLLRRRFLEYLWQEYLVHPGWRAPTPEHFSALNAKMGCTRKRNEVYLVSTVLNLYNAALLALERSDEASAHLIFIDQTPQQAQANRDLMQRWPESPFESVDYLLTRGKGGRGKIAMRKAELDRLGETLRGLRPSSIATGNDRRIEFLYAMHRARLDQNVVGVYMDDGLYSYVEHTKPWWQETILHRLAGMMVYGTWYRRWRTVGASPLIGRAYLAFPELACPPVAGKNPLPLPLHLSREPEMTALASGMLEQSGYKADSLASLEAILVVPHISLLKKDSRLSDRIRGLVGRWFAEGKTVGIKNHPRNPPEALKRIGCEEKGIRLPSGVAFEALLPLLGSVVVAGAASTVLLSCRWLRPDIDVYCLDTDSETVQLYKRLGVKPYPGLKD